MAAIDYRTPGRIRPTPATQALFDEMDRLRAEKFTHPCRAPEWLRLGGEVCKLTEQVRKIVQEGK